MTTMKAISTPNVKRTQRRRPSDSESSFLFTGWRCLSLSYPAHLVMMRSPAKILHVRIIVNVVTKIEQVRGCKKKNKNEDILAESYLII